MATSTANPARSEKTRIVRWCGVLAQSTRIIRLTVGFVLAVASVALAFTQLGFASIGLSGDLAAYAIVILQPVALGSLLLGTLSGALLGLLAGTALYAHASLMPLDLYELKFVTPLTSIIMLAVTGFLLGILFAFVLRKNPSRVKRIIYITIVCFIISWLYSIGFVTNVFFLLIADIAFQSTSVLSEAELDATMQAGIASAALRLGNVDLQAWVDAILMAIFCCIGDFLANKAAAHKQRIGLRALFASWLSAVVLLAFMITAGASFVAITQGEISAAAKSMDAELTYLCGQMEASDQHVDSLLKFIDATGIDAADLSEDDFMNLAASVSDESLMTGYTKEASGTIVISFAGDSGSLESSVVYLSDDEHIVPSTELSACFDAETLSAIEASLESGDIQRILYDESQSESVASDTVAEQFLQSRISYLLARQTGSYTVINIMPSNVVFAERGTVMLWTTISEFVLLLAVFAMTALLLNRVVVRRIDDMNKVLARITDGDLDARVDVRNTREFESLTNGVNKTVDALRGWIAEAENRIDAELATAKEIQESALPRVFPPFPDILKFDIYASMNAAREVGGDFYDFFLIEGNADAHKGKLGFVIADVSGKGVPAALFMMKAKTQLRDYMESGMELGEAVENTNRQLCDGNDAGMFVTAWAGVLDYTNGHIDYVNAGHNPPLLWSGVSNATGDIQRCDSPDEGDPSTRASRSLRMTSWGAAPLADDTTSAAGWQWLAEKSGLPLGLFDGLPYEAHSIDCQIGDQLLLYTDGVTEAMDTEGNLYGEDRLINLADAHYTLHPRMLIEAVRHDVAVHAAGAEQSDDITLLALEIGVPPEITATLVVAADVDELPRVNDFIHTELDRRLCPLRTQNQIDIAVEELFVNVAHYAYPNASPGNPGVVRVSYTYSAEPPSIKVDIADDGIPYDPLAKPDAVTPDDIMDVPIGGLGILMAKKSVDEMSYERVDNSNIVTIVKRW